MLQHQPEQRVIDSPRGSWNGHQRCGGRGRASAASSMRGSSSELCAVRGLASCAAAGVAGDSCCCTTGVGTAGAGDTAPMARTPSEYGATPPAPAAVGTGTSEGAGAGSDGGRGAGAAGAAGRGHGKAAAGPVVRSASACTTSASTGARQRVCDGHTDRRRYGRRANQEARNGCAPRQGQPAAGTQQGSGHVPREVERGSALMMSCRRGCRPC